MVEWTTAVVTASATSVVQFAFWVLFRRWIERMDIENGVRDARIKELEEKRVAAIENQLKVDGEKRALIYRRLEAFQLDWMSKKECRELHAADAAHKESYMASVLKLERVATEVARLVAWVDEINREQISLGKDLSAIGDRVNNLRSQK